MYNIFIFSLISMYSRKVSKGGNIDTILEGDESIDLGIILNFHKFILFQCLTQTIYFC